MFEKFLDSFVVDRLRTEDKFFEKKKEDRSSRVDGIFNEFGGNFLFLMSPDYLDLFNRQNTTSFILNRLSNLLPGCPASLISLWSSTKILNKINLNNLDFELFLSMSKAE